jgi:hypothetical protein
MHHKNSLYMLNLELDWSNCVRYCNHHYDAVSHNDLRNDQGKFSITIFDFVNTLEICASRLILAKGCEATDAAATGTTTGVDSCATSTVTDVVVSCYPGATASCTTLSTAEVTGCSITATTTTETCSGTQPPTATPSSVIGGTPGCELAATYVVWPNNGSDSTQTTAIATQFKTLADPSKITELDSSGYGVVYWTLPLTASQADELSKFANVRPESEFLCAMSLI